ncbi:MAG: EamA family transporter [Firmicutes bacterium]|nr:EamA family transporter [Bacillota bacterium]
MNQHKHSLSAKIALFGATIIWGSSFLIVKNSMDVMQPHMLLAFRFTIGGILLCIIFHKRLKNLNKEYFIKGGILGTLLFVAYSLQTIGITDTTPGKNAFLTAIYCVLVPFFFWPVDKKKPDNFNLIAAFISIIGIGLVSLNGDLSIRMGDGLTLISGVIYAIHMVAVAKFSGHRDPILLTILQFGYAAVYSWLIGLLFEDIPTNWSTGSVIGLLYLAVFATALALLLQNVGQKYTHPAPAAIIMSLESVFGALFSVLFYHEIITPRLFVGFGFIFIAVIISETKLSFLFKLKSKVRKGTRTATENEILTSEEMDVSTDL